MHHLALHPQCGICTDMMFRHERVIAFFGNGNSTSYHGQTRPFLFPDVQHTITTVDGFRLCRYPNCKTCAASPHFIPVHYECFNIFRHYCTDAPDALDRLWTAAAWRIPWQGARPVHLPGYRLDITSLKELSRVCQLSQLCKLPPELLSIIQGYSEHALFWRAVSAHSFAARILSSSPEPLLTMSLGDILFWKRGGKPEKRRNDYPPGVSLVRFTIDSDGISKIERVSSHVFKEGPRNGFAYIVEQERKIAKFAAQLKDGLLRLDLPPGQPNPRIWNTPDPPDLFLCTPYISSYPSWQRFFAIDTGCISGITFFFSLGRLVGIHPHYSNALDAMPTYRRFSHRRRRSLIWAFQPIAKHDRLLVLGTRESLQGDFNVLIRTEQAGDVAIGPYIPIPARDRCLGWRPPISLIYNEPIEGHEISFLGAYCGLPRKMELPKPFAVERLRSNPLGEHAHLSRAPLTDVASAEIFYDEETQYCRGIMFRYHDGACRVVGQCRVHVDATKRVSRPLRFCYRIDTRHLCRQVVHSAQVTLQKGPCHRHNEGWNCHQFDGMLNFWFTADSSFITIEN
ncbi:uncharacterized protein F4812DRAFT_214061 [Daldinia caldariorum]|uniref:uncharacterized protein n=1 Tax=Daldinia caldariorum TaxID=326644 RepID=UPI0020077FCB|nr:uncharacterized protein F4812DRAFT_214061 [Daldinia caldariorum]KAI1464152.1 hypothetical protein F4812DRAFT_214061 [Daldinia caldariorum]